ncbi:hypothetical protein H0H87_000004 [Tephrocybe sp. NHM501043]|nr:hypothetical protein H0H87_000004 [Tephrocybe sp. NHM501043]
MNGVEAAASLFGSDEPGSDPFASLGGETAPEYSSDNLFNVDGASNNFAFYDNSSQDVNVTAAVQDSSAPDTSQYYTHPDTASGYGTHNAYASLVTDTSGQEGWYDQQGNGQAYAPQSYPTPSPADRYTVPSQEPSGPYDLYAAKSTQGANTYAPPASNIYAPPVPSQVPPPAQISSSYAPPAQAPTSSAYLPPAATTTTTDPYNPYVPAQPAQNYTPSQPIAPTASTYSPYTPAASQGYSSQYTSPYAGASQSAYTPVTSGEQPAPPKLTPSGVVPAPSAATTVTRPKLPNAYDPPFPTTVKTRRTARTGSGQNAYGYNTYESPPVPAYGLPLQTSPYVSQQTPLPPQAAPPSQRLPPPPLPQATPPPPQRLPPPPLPAGPTPPHPQRLPPPALPAGPTPPPPQHLPPPPPPQPRLPPQSMPPPPPPIRESAAPVKGSYSSSGMYEAQNGPAESAGRPSYGLGFVEVLHESEDPENTGESTNMEEEFPPSIERAGGADSGHLPQDSEDPQAFSYNVSIESAHANAPSSQEVPTQPSATPSVNGPNHPSTSGPLISLSTSFRSDSPGQHPLPPSPTGSLQQGRSSPFAEPNILVSKRTASPRSFVEPMNGDSYAPLRDAVPIPPSRSPAQMYSSPLRSSSPATYNNGVRSPPLGNTNPYLPRSVVGGERVGSPANTPNGHATDPYAPKTHVSAYKGERTNSPSSYAARAVNGAPPVGKTYPANPYAPVKPDPRNRSMSNSSVLSSASTNMEDPYAPSQQNRRVSNDVDRGSYAPVYSSSMAHDSSPSKVPEHSVIQELSVKPFQTPYAPSPSLLGANDPLGRTSARVPVFSFGFGGKFVTCFHGADSLNTGFDVALASRNSTGIHIRVLNTLISESALDIPTATFPGPLFGEAGASSTSLVRTGAASQTKTKKGKVTKYLAERTDELALGLRYIRPDSIESRQAEGKLVLVKLLQLMVEHDGRLTGTYVYFSKDEIPNTHEYRCRPELDSAVRLALVPRLEGTFGSNGFLSVADTPVVSFSSEPQETPISVTTLRASTLDKIQDFLLRGERRQAYHLALDEKLWAHAMIISSSIDKEAWKEVVHEFLRTELGMPVAAQSKDDPSSGRESLRVAYSLFSGQGATAVQELAPQNLLARAAARPAASIAPHLTPRTPNFAAVPTQGASLPPQALAKWTETAAMILSSPLSAENSATLTALGDQLAANQMFEAAHVWYYLLAPQTSPLGGLGHPSARIVLVGSRNPQTWPSFAKDQDPMIFSEIVEFALSLATPAKGQEPFTGIPHLQAYRFIRSMALAEMGDIQQANKYCDAISAAVTRGSIYATPVFLDQLKGLHDRIAGVTQVDKSFWTGAKLSKPSLDSIGGWLEGRFTKLVTGDAELDNLPEEITSKPDECGFSGPFSHYSTISSTTPSARSSPQPSMVNLNVLPPARSGSAMAHISPNVNPPIDRASSAMDYSRPKPSPPAPRILSANASITSFAHTPSFGQALSTQTNGYSPSDDLVTPRPSLVAEEDEGTSQEATWWGGTAYAEGPATATPTMSSFMRVDAGALPASASSDGFISLMDITSYAPRPTASSGSSAQASPHPEDEEDLGFGNSSNKPRAANRQPSSDGNVDTSSSSGPEPVKPAPPPAEENKPQPPSGWLSRWWKKSDASPGPVKASLGEESAFYYDKDLKRWVNKKSGADAAKPAAPPPPPSRAQTASPGMTGPRQPEAGAPPPNRSASAIDLSTSPPSRTTMRVRSNLVPTPESAPSTPTGTRLAPGSGPPPGRPKSQASKRNIRNRYVDVFQQKGAA